MKASQTWLDENPGKDYLKLTDLKPHTVKLVADANDTFTPRNGEARSGVRYQVVENGIEKEFFTSSRELIAELVRFNSGDVVIIQATKQNEGENNEFTTYSVEPKDDIDKVNEETGAKTYPDGSVINE